jgi:signal transduction histidine kinase
MQKITAAGGNSDDEFKMTDGRHVHVRRFPLERGGYVSVYTDISEQAKQRVQLEDERTKAVKANITKTDFVMNLSHEMRDPLHSIIGFSDVILKSKADPLNDRTKATVELINSTGRHMLELINGILDLSKLKSGVVELDESTFEVDEFLNDTAGMMASKANEASVSLSVENEAGIGRKLIADRLMMRQVLINLVGNAIKFAPGGHVKILADMNDGCLSIAVQDDGVGIPPEDLPTITDIFKQARTNDPEQHGGSGIGLAIAKRLAALHDCEFELESTVGEGTRVTIKFPKARLG